MYDTIRMQVLSANILLESENDNTGLIEKLVLSNISLLRHLGAITGNEDYTDLSHIMTEAALQSKMLSDGGKEEIQSLINNEEQNE